MKQENNFEVKDIDLQEMDAVIEIKDEELKQITGGRYTSRTQAGASRCEQVH